VDVGLLVIPHAQTAKLIEPGKRPLRPLCATGRSPARGSTDSSIRRPPHRERAIEAGCLVRPRSCNKLGKEPCARPPAPETIAISSDVARGARNQQIAEKLGIAGAIAQREDNRTIIVAVPRPPYPDAAGAHRQASGRPPHANHIRIIQLMLGHADVKQTQRYLNITDEELRKAMTGAWERRRQLRAVGE
jgi:hypothetical protein